jgi:phospholipase A1
MRTGLLVAGLALALASARGNAAGMTDEDCAALKDDAERLRCYDEIHAPTAAAAGSEYSYLARAWRLGNYHDAKTELISAYRPTYLLLWRKSNDPNETPSTPAPDHTVTEPQDLDASEAKFQLSFKTEVARASEMDFMGFRGARLWAAYTQQSSWQVFNVRNSRPFRETDYEPELIGTFDRDAGGAGFKLVNLGLVHQSNGRADPLSRSWNRFYVQGGWEWPKSNVSVLARVWARVDSDRNDDNPDIMKYMGHGDIITRWESKENCAVDYEKSKCHRVWITLRPNPGRGFLQIDWTTAWRVGGLRFHVQATSGYGETLIDYNHSQTTFGFGLSVGDW